MSRTTVPFPWIEALPALVPLALAAALAASPPGDGQGAGGPAAAGLASIPRVIAREPAYATDHPAYALVVLGGEPGREAQAPRVWLVVDGRTLYVDRDGDGDLTEPGERVEASSVTPEGRLYIEHRRFDAGDLEAGRTAAPPTPPPPPCYTGLRVTFSPYNPAFQTDRADLAGIVEAARRLPGAHRATVLLRIKGKERTEMARTRFGASPAEAPILHFDGPLTLGVTESIAGLRLERGRSPNRLEVSVGTPGLGPMSFTSLRFDLFPEGLRPHGEIEFPAAGGARGHDVASRPVRRGFRFASRC